MLARTLADGAKGAVGIDWQIGLNDASAARDASKSNFVRSAA